MRALDRARGTTAHLRDLFVKPDFDGAAVEVSFTMPKTCRGGSWKIAAGRRTITAGSVPRRKGRILLKARMPGFRPWSIEDPFLYRLVLALNVDGGDFRVVQDFGMRKFHVAGRQIHLNNKPFYVRGVVRGREAHDHPNLSGLSETEYYAKFIRAAKALGFNLIRFHSRVPPEAYFQAADRLGILTHVEVRKYYGKYQKERELMDHDPVLVRPADWRRMILSIRNHASLMAYCLGNEINQPGRNPQVCDRARQLRRLDPTRLFIDTCARGEYDRGSIDFDVQHMGYFAPFGRNYGMFDTSANWAIFGSIHGKLMVQGGPPAATRREVPVNFPVLAHETGHYIALRDLESLKRKCARCGVQEPWWIDELIKLRRLKGLEKDYPRMLNASQRYQYLWHKQVFESIRKSPILGGFHFLQMADTERYENANGLLDCFDDIKPNVDPAAYRRFNDDAVLVADLPRRTFFEKEKLQIPIWLSNCSGALRGEGTLQWRIKAAAGRAVVLQGRLDRVDVEYGRSRIATIEITWPAADRAQALVLDVSLTCGRMRPVSNEWNLWLYPNRPETLAIGRATVCLTEINLVKRYPQLAVSEDLARPERLLISDRFSDPVFRHLHDGGDVLILYRVAETRARRTPSVPVPRERYYMPCIWDRFKAVIWDRGHNLGGFTRPHPALRGFPTDGYIDFQFAGIIDDCDKLSLDGFPAAVQPIVQGVDKAVRDRYDVFTFKLPELQPGWTMRKFAYLFDLRVGTGRVMMCGFNLTGLQRDVPEACAMFETLAACVSSPAWRPKATLSVDELKDYLARKGRQPRIKERKMTQYWQLDDAPLESAQYWQEAEEWIRRG